MPSHTIAAEIVHYETKGSLNAISGAEDKLKT